MGGSLYVPPEAEIVLHKKSEKKSPPDEEIAAIKSIKKVPKQPQKIASPPHTKVSGQGIHAPPSTENEKYKIKKKEGKGDRDRQHLEKEEQMYAPVTKSVKTELKSSLGPRHEEHLPGYGGLHGYRSQTGQRGDMMTEPTRPLMSSQGSQRPYGGYYQQQQPSLEETEAQFSDDETYTQTKPTNIAPQTHGSQFQSKYPAQTQGQGQGRPQMQQRDHQQMRLQHPSYHPGPQPHIYPSQPQMGQYPLQGQIQQRTPPVQTRGTIQPQQMGQPSQAMRHHIGEHPSHYAGQAPIQATTKSRMTNEPIPFQPLSPQSQIQPHFGSHQMRMESGSQPLGAQKSASSKERLMEIRQTFENSRNIAMGGEAGVGSTKAADLPDFEYPCNTDNQKRADYIPGVLELRKGSEIPDQSNVLIFKSLLMHEKQQLPDSIKMKYKQKIGKIESLSSLIAR